MATPVPYQIIHILKGIQDMFLGGTGGGAKLIEAGAPGGNQSHSSLKASGFLPGRIYEPEGLIHRTDLIGSTTGAVEGKAKLIQQ